MSSRFLRAAAPLLLAFSANAAAQTPAPITPQQMMRHIEVLASDEFEGRAPATAGETKTTDYIVAQLGARGFEAGGPDGSWYQPVPLIERRAGSHRARWFAGGRQIAFDEGRIILAGRQPTQTLERAPAIFVGHGLVDPARGIDQLAGAELEGAIAFVLLDGPQVPGFPTLEERAATLAAAGAVAVVAIVADEVPWANLVSGSRERRTELDSDAMPPIFGAIPAGELTRLVDAAGGNFEALLNEQPGPSFRAVPLALSGSMEITTEIRRFRSNNVVGRLRGSAGGESVLLMGHWDHLGLCRPEGEADRICNGAVDNASGIAMLIEVAGRLSAGRRPERDLIVLATTVEEVGLLGAKHFAAWPTVPLGSIVAAINLDTVAIHGAGEPVAIIGRGTPELDMAIAETAAALGRRMDTTYAADAFIRRQDGWAFTRAGVPSVMVGGSFANMDVLQAFLAGNYHGPDDEVRSDIPLEGAAEDANLLVALVRRLASPAQYRPAQR